MSEKSEDILARDPTVEPAKRAWDWTEAVIPPLPKTGGFLILEHKGTEEDANDGNKKKEAYWVRMVVAAEVKSFRWQPPSGTEKEWFVVDVPIDFDPRRGSQISRAWKSPATMVGDPVIVHGKP